MRVLGRGGDGDGDGATQSDGATRRATRGFIVAFLGRSSRVQSVANGHQRGSTSGSECPNQHRSRAVRKQCHDERGTANDRIR